MLIIIKLFPVESLMRCVSSFVKIYEECLRFFTPQAVYDISKGGSKHMLTTDNE